MKWFWEAVSFPHSNRLALALLLGESVVGALLGMVGRAWPPIAATSAFAIGAVLAAGVRLPDRWTWPWQHVIASVVMDTRSAWARIVGGSYSPEAAQAWLDRWPQAPVGDRMRVLASLGRWDEARALPPETTDDRLRVAFYDSLALWRSTGVLDWRHVRPLLPELDDEERRRTLLYLAYWEGLTHLAAGNDLRAQAVPDVRGYPLPPTAWLTIWRARFWPVTWFVFMFVVTWVVLTVAQLAADR